MPLTGHIDLAEETRRLEKERSGLARETDSARAKLANPDYVGKAPEEIVEETRRRLADLEARRGAVERSLALLKDML